MPTLNLVIAMLALAPGAAAAVPQEDLGRAEGATVVVKAERSLRDLRQQAVGSGFFIDGKGHALTNWRLVAPETTVRPDGRDSEAMAPIGSIGVVVASGQPDELTLSARVLRLDRARGLALLEVEYASPWWLDVSAPPEVAAGEAVLVLGYPGAPQVPGGGSAETAARPGTVIAVRRGARGEAETLRLKATLDAEHCGGPVLDGRGAVVGVVGAASGDVPGGALAVGPARLREFVSEAQFDVRLTPPWVPAGRESLLVEVLPLLRSVGGLSGEVTLRAGAVEVVKRELTVRLGSLAAQMTLPPASQAGGPASYTLTVRLADAAGRATFEHAWAVPARGGGATQAASGRAEGGPPYAAAGPRPAARAGGASPPGSVPLPGDESRGSMPLTRLASGVRLHTAGDASGLVVTNSNLGRVPFVVVETHYTSLPPALRPIAIEFDRAEFTLGTLTVGVTYGSDTGASAAPAAAPGSGGPFVSKAVGGAKAAAAATVSQASAGSGGSAEGAGGSAGAGTSSGGTTVGLGQEIGDARAGVEGARAKVLRNALCRCPDRTWFRSADPSRCPRCASP